MEDFIELTKLTLGGLVYLEEVVSVRVSEISLIQNCFVLVEGEWVDVKESRKEILEKMAAALCGGESKETV